MSDPLKGVTYLELKAKADKLAEAGDRLRRFAEAVDQLTAEFDDPAVVLECLHEPHTDAELRIKGMSWMDRLEGMLNDWRLALDAYRDAAAP